MGLLELYLKKELATFVRDRVRLRTIGRIDGLPAGVQRHLAATVEKTKDFTDYTLVLALNYGSRTEVVDAARAYAAAVAAGPREAERRLLGDLREVPVHGGHARPRPRDPHLGRDAHQQLPPPAGRLRRVLSSRPSSGPTSPRRTWRPRSPTMRGASGATARRASS